MIVSWEWLGQYVALEMPLEDLTTRLTMSGLNLEGTDTVDSDTAIDLEVTSNRPDCLGHLGVAREVSVLYDLPLKSPDPQPPRITPQVSEVASVEITCPELCPRYTARLIRGVTVGPSPDWLVRRLATLGIVSINNIVDITNYVLMETGQPLHAFDFDKLADGRIVVRQATAGEQLEAINHTTYKLAPGMCVIADAEKPVALAGVMGGSKPRSPKRPPPCWSNPPSFPRSRSATRPAASPCSVTRRFASSEVSTRMDSTSPVVVAAS